MLKQYHRYRMDFTSRALTASSVCMGLSLFLSVVYYLGIRELTQTGISEWIFLMILPGILSAAYIILIHVLRYDAPGLYGLLGAVLCILLAIGTLFTGSALRIVLGIVWYLFCGVMLLGSCGGFLPDKRLASALIGVGILVRLLCFDVGKLSLVQWIPEAGTLFAVAALMLLPAGIKAVKSEN